MRRVERYPVSGKNSMHFRRRLASLPRVAWNFAVIEVCRFVPFLRVKNFCFRHLLGMQVGRDASVGLMAMFDIFLPHYISIGEDAVLGYNCTILCHEFLPREYRVGRVEIGKGVLIGANATILPGVVIGEGAMVCAGSVVTGDIPPYTLAGGVPARVIRQLERETGES